MKERASVVRQLCNLGQRMLHADLIVSRHHADKQRLIGNRFAQPLQVESAFSIYAEQAHSEAFTFERETRIEHCPVFGHGRDDVTAILRGASGDPFDRKVVRLGCAAREDDVPMASTDERGDLLTGLLHRFAGFPAEWMVFAGRVAEVFREERQHRIEHTTIDRRRGVRV